jgi:predicted transcriptional regulator
LVEHGDLLSECKQAQEGLLGRSERERGIPNTRIVEALVQDSHTLKDLSKLCKLTPASIDKHLEILIEAGLVKVQSAGGEKKAHLQASKFKPTLDWFKKLTD